MENRTRVAYRMQCECASQQKPGTVLDSSCFNSQHLVIINGAMVKKKAKRILDEAEAETTSEVNTARTNTQAPDDEAQRALNRDREVAKSQDPIINILVILKRKQTKPFVYPKGRAKIVSVKFRTDYLTWLSVFLLCYSVTAYGNVALTVKVLNDKASPVPGARVEVDGEVIGVTGPDGMARAEVDYGAHIVWAFIPGFFYGRRNISISEGQLRAMVEVPLESPDVEIQIAELIQNHILPQDGKELKVRFVNRNGKELEVGKLVSVHFYDLYHRKDHDLTPYFLLGTDGRLTLDPAAVLSFNKILANTRDFIRLRFNVHFENFEKRVVEAERHIIVGRYKLRGALTPPPTNPDMKMGGKTVVATFRPIRPDTLLKIQIKGRTDAKGRFGWDNLPFGDWDLEVKGVNRELYAWDWRVRLYGDASIRVRPESLSELRWKIQPIVYDVQSLDKRFLVDGRPRHWGIQK